MKVFVGEYICGGGFAEKAIDDLPVGMQQEGSAMLRAVIEDLSSFSETVVMLDDRFDLNVEYSKIVPFTSGKPIWSQWIAAARGCDAALIIAPESDGVLAKGVAMLRSAGIDVVAGSGDFLRVASDKFLTAQLLHRAGVAHPLYATVDDQRLLDQMAGFERYVVKPRDGCGTQAIQRFDTLDEAIAAMGPTDILQPWMPGQSISVSLIAAGREQSFLPAVSQTISVSECKYIGGVGPLNDKAQRRATALASRAIAAMPPTARGFVGLDLILGDSASKDCVIEINPRLATSYVGLRKMIEGNLAARLFGIETGPVRCKARANSVSWTPDGTVVVKESAAV